MAASRTRESAPPIQLTTLAKSLAAEGPARAALLKGEERYFADRAIELLTRAASEAGQEVCRHDTSDPEFSLGALLDDLGAAPLFASARCVIVRGADPLLKKTDRSPSPFTRSALAFLESGREGCLVIAGRSIRIDHVVAKAVKAASGAIVTCRKLWDSPPPWDPDPRKVELALWVRKRGEELGVRLDPSDAAYLATATGNDLAAIDTQLEKVRQGGAKRLREVVGWESGGTPWKCADELFSGDVGRGLAAVEALFRSGFHSTRDNKTEVAPEALNAMLLQALRSKIRQVLAGAGAMERGAAIGEAADLAGVPAGKLARSAFENLVGRRDAAGWEVVYREIASMERKNRLATTLDASDYYRLALSLREPERSPRGTRR
jgi:hypothetical protein